MMNLTEATMLALQGKLCETKTIVTRDNWVIHNDHEANWFGVDACYKDVRELNLKELTDEEKIKALQFLKDNIDTDIKQRADYNNIDDKYISIWLDGYKTTIDRLLNEIDTRGKYYIFMSVDVHDAGDVSHRGSGLIIDNGNITKGTKYYNTEEEAQNDRDNISKSQYEEFMKNNFLSDYDEVIQWQVDIKKYEPGTWELK